MKAARWVRMTTAALALLAIVPSTASAQIGAGCTLTNFLQQGFTACPPGSVVTPLGLPVTPQGVVVNPQGLILTPQGQLLTPQGQLVDLQGHNGSSHGQLVSCMARNTPPGHGQDMREVAREGENADIADLTVQGAAAFAVCLTELNNSALTSTGVLPTFIPNLNQVVDDDHGRRGRGGDDDGNRNRGRGNDDGNRGNRGGDDDGNRGRGRGR